MAKTINMTDILGLSVGPLGAPLTQTFRGRSEGINGGGLSSNLMGMSICSHFGSMANPAQSSTFLFAPPPAPIFP